MDVQLSAEPVDQGGVAQQGPLEAQDVRSARKGKSGTIKGLELHKFHLLIGP